MRLQLISDLHTEFYDKPVEFCSTIEIAEDLDFLVIAGDLVVSARQDLNEMMGILHYFGKRARHVIYTEGNHEFYGGSQAQTLFTIKSVMPHNYTWLRNEDVTIDGVHFYGGAMWFPNADGLDVLFREELNDWYQIRHLATWVYAENRQFKWNAEKLVTKDTIVISHHLPHLRSVPEEYKDSNTTRFFVSDQTKLIEEKQPRLWFHGHTHFPCDYMMGDTHVVCHPYGYPKERRGRGPYLPLVFEV